MIDKYIMGLYNENIFRNSKTKFHIMEQIRK